MEAAPEWLLKVVRCNCKTTSQKQCSTKICSCRRNGLHCVPACGQCHGEGCGNAPEPPPDSDDENELDSDSSERNIFEIFESLT